MSRGSGLDNSSITKYIFIYDVSKCFPLQGHLKERKIFVSTVYYLEPPTMMHLVPLLSVLPLFRSSLSDASKALQVKLIINKVH